MRHLVAIILCVTAFITMLALPISAADETTTDEYAEVTIGGANSNAPVVEWEEIQDDIQEDEKNADQMTEDELREIVLRVAEAVGAYEDDVPAAGKVKAWIINNLASIVGFLMALSLLIATPVGRKIFKNFITALKASMTTVGEWKGELEGIIAKNGEKNAELRASVNELMAQMTREVNAALARAEAAEIRASEAEEKLLTAEKNAAEQLAKSTAVNEAICRAVLVMAKPLEMSVQRSKALDEMQKHEVFTEYKDALDTIHGLLNETTTEEEADEDVD